MKSKFSKFNKKCNFVFTDGGMISNPGDAGAGIYIVFPDFQQEISIYLGKGTNNFAELRAIEEGLKEIIRQNKQEQKTILYSDSKYALGVLNNNWNLTKNQDLITRIKGTMALFADLSMVHVKGHSGIYGNEKADKLAFWGKKKRIVNRQIKNKNFIHKNKKNSKVCYNKSNEK